MNLIFPLIAADQIVGTATVSFASPGGSDADYGRCRMQRHSVD